MESRVAARAPGSRDAVAVAGPGLRSSVVRFVGRTHAPREARETAETTNRARECARDRSGHREAALDKVLGIATCVMFHHPVAAAAPERSAPVLESVSTG
jgi:hypothetical protein